MFVRLGKEGRSSGPGSVCVCVQLGPGSGGEEGKAIVVLDDECWKNIALCLGRQHSIGGINRSQHCGRESWRAKLVTTMETIKRANNKLAGTSGAPVAEEPTEEY